MFTSRIVTTVVLIAALVTGCASKPSIDYRTDFDFDGLRSFSVLPVDKAIFDNPKVSEIEVHRMLKIISRELGKRYLEVPQGQADFHVRPELVVEERVRNSQPTTTIGVYRGGFGYHMGVQGSSGQTNYYQQGTMIIDVLTIDSGEVVWRGSVDGRMRENLTPAQRDANVEKRIVQLFAAFPP